MSLFRGRQDVFAIRWERDGRNRYEDKVFINTDTTILHIDQLDLPIQVERFKTEVAWKIRVLNYDEENSEIAFVLNL